MAGAVAQENLTCEMQICRSKEDVKQVFKKVVSVVVFCIMFEAVAFADSA